MMNAADFGPFKGMYEEMTWYALKEAGDRKKKLLIGSDPFSDLFVVLIIKYPRYSLFNKIYIVGNGMFAEKEMIFGDRPVFPCM